MPVSENSAAVDEEVERRAVRNPRHRRLKRLILSLSEELRVGLPEDL
jgi:hypothetical protein